MLLPPELYLGIKTAGQSFGFVTGPSLGLQRGGGAAPPPPILGSTWTGLGASNDFSDAANWDIPPSAGDNLIFSGTTRLTPNNNAAALTSFGDITFANGAGAFVIGGNSITLTGTITNNDASTQTINLAVVVAATRTINCAVGDIVFGGRISGAGGLTKSGAGLLTLSDASTYSGATTISAGQLKTEVAMPISPLVYYTMDSIDVSDGGMTNYGDLGVAAKGILSNGTIVQGKRGNAISFSGTTSGLKTDSAVTVQDEVTLAAWVSTTANNSGYARLIVNDFTTSVFLGTNFSDPGRYFSIIANQFENVESTTNPEVDTSGAWHHVAMVWDGTNNRLYYDGVLVSNYPVLHVADVNLTNLFYVGCGDASYGGSWQGKMDDVFVYDRALTAEEVRILAITNVLPAATATTVGAGGTLHVGGAGVISTLTVGSLTFTDSTSKLLVEADGMAAVSAIIAGAVALNNVTVDFNEQEISSGTYVLIYGTSMTGTPTQGVPPYNAEWVSLSVVGNNLVAEIALLP